MISSPGESRPVPVAFRRGLFVALSVIGICAVAVFLLVPSIDVGGPGNRRGYCTNNMRNAGGALLHYAESHQGNLPPAFVADKNGKPINSWRVLILREMDHPNLADTYDLAEPWNGPNNRKLQVADRQEPTNYDFNEPWNGPHNRILQLFSLRNQFWCPAASALPTGLTNYLVVTGPGTLFPGARPVNLKDVKDSLENTILLVEVADSDINWMEPRDLTFDEALQGINATIHGKRGKGMSISSKHSGDGAYVMFADGHVRFLEEHTSPALLKALLTIDGGEDLKALGW
jgi:prepilin-type processing-associated H-X9-DG protein